jgi:ribose transport system permease protein
MTASIKSTALEPDRALDGEAISLMQRLGRAMPVYGLVVLTVGLGLLFSLLLPDTFPTLFNLRAILADKSVIALLALAAGGGAHRQIEGHTEQPMETAA